MGPRKRDGQINTDGELNLDPHQYLHSSDSDEGDAVYAVRVEDKCSKPQRAFVDIQGVPAEGIIDSVAHITIMGAEIFKKVAAVAYLMKSWLKKVDMIPYTYDQKLFKLMATRNWTSPFKVTLCAHQSTLRWMHMILFCYLKVCAAN